MHDCAACGRPLAGGDGRLRCRCSSPAGRLRADGGRRSDSPDGQADDEPEDWERQLRPPHWERQGRRSGRSNQQAGDNTSQAETGPQQDQTATDRSPAGDEPGSGPPEAWQAGQGGRTLGRRELLVGGAGAVALAAGGWWVLLRGSDDPEAAVRTYLAAIEDRDHDRLMGVLHGDGPMAERFDMTEAEFRDLLGSVDIDVEAVEQYDEEGAVDRPTVQRFAFVLAAFTLRQTPSEEDSRPDRDTSDPELRTERLRVALHPDGDWLLWSQQRT